MVVVMEYCDLGSLRKALRRRAFLPSAKWPFQTTYVRACRCRCAQVPPPADETPAACTRACEALVQRALLRTAQEVAQGMEYIHQFNVVHGDLKPGNVLLRTHKVDRRGYVAKVGSWQRGSARGCTLPKPSLPPPLPGGRLWAQPAARAGRDACQHGRSARHHCLHSSRDTCHQPHEEAQRRLRLWHPA